MRSLLALALARAAPAFELLLEAKYKDERTDDDDQAGPLNRNMSSRQGGGAPRGYRYREYSFCGLSKDLFAERVAWEAPQPPGPP